MLLNYFDIALNIYLLNSKFNNVTKFIILVLPNVELPNIDTYICTYMKMFDLYFQGITKASGADTGLFYKANFPKSFFYGTYKFRYYYTKNNEVYGCFIIVIELKRPWETNN